MNKLFYLFVLVFLTTTISALTIHSGESVEIELEKSFEYYSIVGNSTEVIVDIIQEGNNVTITPNKYSLEDTYEIVFFDINNEVIVNYQSSCGSCSGGGVITKYKDNETIKYLDNETIIHDDKEIEVEKIVKKVPLWSWIVLGLLIIGIIFYIAERRLERNENE